MWALTCAAVAGDASAVDGLADLAESERSQRAAAIATLAALHAVPQLAGRPSDAPADADEAIAEALALHEIGEPSRAVELAHAWPSRRSLRTASLIEDGVHLLEGAVVARREPARLDGPGALHVVTNALPTTVAGYTTRTHGIASALVAAGIPTTVATRLGFPITAGALRAANRVMLDGVMYRRQLPWRLPLGAADAASAEATALVDVARESGAGILHAHSHHVNGTIALAARDVTSLPVVYEVRGMLEETWIARGGSESSEFVRLSRAAETRVMTSADAVVTLSQGMRDTLVARGVDAARITVIPNSVSADWTAPTSASGEALGLPECELLVGSVTTVSTYEGLELVPEIVTLLRRSGIDAHGVIVGSGDALPAVRRRVGELDLDAHVTTTGRVSPSAARAYHQAIDVFLLPRVDSWLTRTVTPIKPIEAMATGSIVVASDLPALRETVEPGGGVLVEGRTATEWVAAIAPLADASRRELLGAQGREWVIAERTWTSAAERYSALYAALRKS